MIGEETLNRISRMPRFNQWMFEMIKPGLGKRILEAGAGIGNITEFLLSLNGDVLATDVNYQYMERLRERLNHPSRLGTVIWNIADPPPEEVKSFGADTIVCLNVLEHIRDDRQTLLNLSEALRKGGRLVLLVPAHPYLYSSLDKGLEHFRRYHWKGLKSLLEQTGYRIEKHFYMNFAGILGWWFHGKLLKRAILPTGSLNLYHRMVPLFRMIERLIFQRLGLSVVVFAVRD